jgi:DNA ligase-1
MNIKMSGWREFRREGRGKNATLIWKIKQESEKYITEHGQLGGAQQTFSDIPGEKGKPGTKAYVGAVDNCAWNILREIRKKEEAGYAEFIDGKYVNEITTSISFDKALPKNFTSYKPQTDISESSLEKIHKAGLARYTRKYDGQMHAIVKHPTGFEIYSRRMDVNSEKFPYHIIELETFDIPDGTILVGEMVCQREDGTDNFKATSRVCRSDPETARKLIEDKECPEPKFLIFDMLFHGGKDLSNTAYDERAKIWRNFKGNLINPVTYHDVTPQNWMEICKTNRWEGFVITDGSAIPGDKFFSFDGTAQRPKGHHKLKPESFTDCVIYAAASGSGKRMDQVGAIFIKQINPETGEFFSCGKVGSGFTEEDIDIITQMCKDKNIPILEKDKDALKINLQDSSHDIVVEVKFSERQEDTNKFRFPVFMRIHGDKKPLECIANI